MDLRYLNRAGDFKHPRHYITLHYDYSFLFQTFSFLVLSFVSVLTCKGPSILFLTATFVLRMMFTMSRPSVLTCVIVAASVSLFLVVFTFFQESLEVPWTYVHSKAEEYLNTNTDTNTNSTSPSYVSLLFFPCSISLWWLHFAPLSINLASSWLTLTIFNSPQTKHHFLSTQLSRPLSSTWLPLYPG